MRVPMWTENTVRYTAPLGLKGAGCLLFANNIPSAFLPPPFCIHDTSPFLAAPSLFPPSLNQIPLLSDFNRDREIEKRDRERRGIDSCDSAL
ncbi:hypothetical protein L1887_00880 [Cichorium endivia]|nr:hypothetical protein L1887_00880 [Cichorium endivia]